ncbi:MAG: hypothetical protein K1060chlam1_00673, partial [Candidatus Anoxychlamydiales bacterium]|nr:hypothetical protein [Candidatus Anoxychlamydiales bacterium]
MALRSVSSSSSAASSSCSSSKKEEETQETPAFEEYYTLGCMAETNGLISDSSKYFKKALGLVKIEKNRSVVQARLDFLDSAFCPSNRSKEVRLINLSVLNHSQIKPFLHQNLLVLVFHNCSNIINETIVLVA